jgi:hypothetical protein
VPDHQFLSLERTRENVRAVLEGNFIGTPAYGLALQAEWLCQLVEGKRPMIAEGKRHRWTPEQDARVRAGEDAAVLADEIGLARRVVMERRRWLRRVDRGVA